MPVLGAGRRLLWAFPPGSHTRHDEQAPGLSAGLRCSQDTRGCLTTPRFMGLGPASAGPFHGEFPDVVHVRSTAKGLDRVGPSARRTTYATVLIAQIMSNLAFPKSTPTKRAHPGRPWRAWRRALARHTGTGPFRLF